MSKDINKRLAEEFERATEGMSPLEKALTIAEVFREVCGGEWVIKSYPTDRFTIERKTTA